MVREVAEVRCAPREPCVHASLLAAEATIRVITGSARTQHLKILYSLSFGLVKPKTA
jgi:hypothetical protein